MTAIGVWSHRIEYGASGQEGGYQHVPPHAELRMETLSYFGIPKDGAIPDEILMVKVKSRKAGDENVRRDFSKVWYPSN